MSSVLCSMYQVDVLATRFRANSGRPWQDLIVMMRLHRERGGGRAYSGCKRCHVAGTGDERGERISPVEGITLFAKEDDPIIGAFRTSTHDN